LGQHGCPRRAGLRRTSVSSATSGVDPFDSPYAAAPQAQQEELEGKASSRATSADAVVGRDFGSGGRGEWRRRHRRAKYQNGASDVEDGDDETAPSDR